MHLTTDQWQLLGTYATVGLLALIAGSVLYGMTHSRKPGESAPDGSGILERLRNEPALVSSLIGYVVLVASHYGLDLPTEFEAIAAALVFTLTGISIRARVTPVRKLEG